jgi:hypothetical protein
MMSFSSISGVLFPVGVRYLLASWINEHGSSVMAGIAVPSILQQQPWCHHHEWVHSVILPQFCPAMHSSIWLDSG